MSSQKKSFLTTPDVEKKHFKVHICFSNSLIIHRVKTRKSQPWRRFGYPVLISIHFDDLLLRLLLSFCFDWEDISNTRDSVSSAIQTPRISSKILRCASYFELSSRCLDIPMKHGLSYLIYYMKHLKVLVKWNWWWNSSCGSKIFLNFDDSSSYKKQSLVLFHSGNFFQWSKKFVFIGNCIRRLEQLTIYTMDTTGDI